MADSYEERPAELPSMNNNASVWDNRLARAEKMAEDYPFARELLSFYREILIFQKDLYNSLSEAIEADPEQEMSCPFHGGAIALHLPLLVTFFPSFLSLIKRVGTQELSGIAGKLLAASGEGGCEALLESYWEKHLRLEDFNQGPALLFFPKAFLQPYAELMACNHPQVDYDQEWHVAEGGGAACPLCGSKPQLAVLRSEAEGAKRSLLCSLCATEWRYKRACCPSCGEERFAKLSYHRAPDFPHVRVEVCESCKKYIKAIDLTVDGRAVPIVDEIATLPLDLWAVEQGYSKIELNLIGI